MPNANDLSISNSNPFFLDVLQYGQLFVSLVIQIGGGCGKLCPDSLTLIAIYFSYLDLPLQDVSANRLKIIINNTAFLLFQSFFDDFHWA